MEQNTESNLDFKNKLINFYNLNKVKVYISIIIFVIILIIVSFINYQSEKKNKLIAERYVQAGLFLASNKKDIARDLYEEIILSKNNFYSILALNTIIEKDLISSNEKILDYFKTLEETSLTKENYDLVILKKALYLIKTSDIEKGKNLLQILIDKNSNLKKIAQELIEE
tara:strand:- start:294 stop:803 length:510 start_codon:yes stop_codon:yes gene_type:complete